MCHLCSDPLGFMQSLQNFWTCLLLKLVGTHYLTLLPKRTYEEKKKTLQQDKPWYAYYFCGFKISFNLII